MREYPATSAQTMAASRLSINFAPALAEARSTELPIGEFNQLRCPDAISTHFYAACAPVMLEPQQ